MREMKKKAKTITSGIGIGLLFSWTVYTMFFQKYYQTIVIFTTDDAPPLIRILELLDYQGKELSTYFIFFFLLTALTFLYCFFLYLVKKSKKQSYRNLICISFLFILMMVYNCVNRLAILLIVLIIAALLIMYSLAVTVNYLFIEKAKYEIGDIVHTEGPFSSERQAREYSTLILAKNQFYFEIGEFTLASDIYEDDQECYYVDIYIGSPLNI